MPASVPAIVAVIGGSGNDVEAAGLRQVWSQVTDPRDARGRRHSLVVILSLVQAAVVSGAVSFAAIRHWIGRVPQQVLADIGARQSPRTGRFEAVRAENLVHVMRPASIRG
jgi:hypothetical protein